METRLHVIREQDPLKQGLKLNKCALPSCADIIREQDPLKQGLKLPLYLPLAKSFIYS